MKKIGIITLNGNFNFGNRLQNYALVKYIEKLGFNVTTIWFCNFKEYAKEMVKRIAFIFFNKRKHLFLSFTDKYIKPKYYFNCNVSDKYDCFVVGSDQVWNYEFPSFNSNMFLSFSNSDKNISYAASFGVDSIPKNYFDTYKKGLNNIKYISVREDAGAEIVRNVINKDCDVLIDPTLLMTRSDWDSIARKPKEYDGQKYILCYFLGDMNKKTKDAINAFAEKKGCKIINVLDKDSKYYSVGPREFVWLEKHAELICTDSFHSSVFALIYDRPFVIFRREGKEKNMYSRIDTLLSKFKIVEREFNGKEITKKNIEHNYTNAYTILEKEREKSKKFLDKALNTNIK